MVNAFEFAVAEFDDFPERDCLRTRLCGLFHVTLPYVLLRDGETVAVHLVHHLFEPFNPVWLFLAHVVVFGVHLFDCFCELTTAYTVGSPGGSTSSPRST
jgi:hypothetical protein